MKKIKKFIMLLLILSNMQPYLNSATLTVTSTADSGANTLRGQIAAASTGDVIEFNIISIPSTIMITGNSLNIAKPLTIQGPNLIDGTPIVIDGSDMTPGAGPIFNVMFGGNDTEFNNLTIQNGMGGNGSPVVVNPIILQELGENNITLLSVMGTCGGILVSVADHVKISNCSIIGCQANGIITRYSR